MSRWIYRPSYLAHSNSGWSEEERQQLINYIKRKEAEEKAKEKKRRQTRKKFHNMINDAKEISRDKQAYNKLREYNKYNPNAGSQPKLSQIYKAKQRNWAVNKDLDRQTKLVQKMESGGKERANHKYMYKVKTKSGKIRYIYDPEEVKKLKNEQLKRSAAKSSSRNTGGSNKTKQKSLAAQAGEFLRHTPLGNLF